MLRIFSQIAVLRGMSSRVEHSGALQTQFFHTKPIDDPSLLDIRLKRAYALEQAGEEVRAQEIYKAIIEASPECEKAYQGLWNSWQRTCGFKVPGPQLAWFIEQYKTHISEAVPDNVTPGFKP